MSSLSVLFFFTHDDHLGVLNKKEFEIQDKLVAVFDNDEFSNIFRNVFYNLNTTKLPKPVEEYDVGTILGNLTKEAKNFGTTKESDKTFGIILRQELDSLDYHFTDADASKIEKELWRLITTNDALKASLKEAIQKLHHTNSVLFSKLIAKLDIKNIISPDGEPPASFRSLLNMAWGLSLSFSHEESQKTLGQKFYESISTLLRRYVAEKLDQSKPISGIQAKHERFITNLPMSLSKTSRNLGFVRDKHTRFIDEKTAEIERKQKLRNELSGFVPTSKESLLAQLAAFVGAGSVSTLLDPFVQKTLYPQEQIPKLTKLLEIAPETNKTHVFTELFYQVNSTSTAIMEPASSIGVGVFVAAGFIGVFGLVAISKLLGNRMTKNDRKNADEAKSKYWEKNFMPEAGEILFHFYKDVETLVGYYYDDEVLNNMKKKFMESIENVNYEEEYEFHDHMKLSTDEHKIARYILHEILPHYHKYGIYDDKRTITVNSETFWNFMGKKKNATSNDYLEEIMKDN